MSDILLVDKKLMKPKSGLDISGTVSMAERKLGGELTTMSEGAAYDRVFAGRTKHKPVRSVFDLDSVASYGGFMQTPIKWERRRCRVRIRAHRVRKVW